MPCEDRDAISIPGSRTNARRSPFFDGTVYVAFGGHFGDSGEYHGWVVGLPLRNPGQPVSFQTRARGGGAIQLGVARSPAAARPLLQRRMATLIPSYGYSARRVTTRLPRRHRRGDLRQRAPNISENSQAIGNGRLSIDLSALFVQEQLASYFKDSEGEGVKSGSLLFPERPRRRSGNQSHDYRPFRVLWRTRSFREEM
jgi:hypothetical protein